MRRVITFHGSPGHPLEFQALQNKFTKIPWEHTTRTSYQHLPQYQGYSVNPQIETHDILMGYSFGCLAAIKNFAEKGGDKLVLISPFVYIPEEKQLSGIKKSLLANSFLGPRLIGSKAQEAMNDFKSKSCYPATPSAEYSNYVDQKLTDSLVLQTALLEKNINSKEQQSYLRKIRESQSRIFIIAGRLDQTSIFEEQISPLKKTLPDARLFVIEQAGHALSWTHFNALTDILEKEVFND